MLTSFLHLFVYVPLYVLGPLFPFIQLSLRYDASIDEIIDCASPGLVNDRGDREILHTFQHVVIHLGYVSCGNAIPLTIIIVQL